MNCSDSGFDLDKAGSSLIDFVYSDTDTYLNEVAELYSYNEEIDFAFNRTAFEELMEDFGFPLKWEQMSEDQKFRAIERMAEGIEVTDRPCRVRCIRAFLYLVQGNFGDCRAIEEQPIFARRNIFRIYKAGIFPIFIQLIHFETKNALQNVDSNPCTTAHPRSTPSLSTFPSDPNTSVRLLISIVYMFVMEMLTSTENESPNERELRDQFKEELQQPICGELFHVTLFEMVVKLCDTAANRFPIKKILLLLWKLLLLTLGGSDAILELKNQYRQKAGLKAVFDDTLEVAKRIRPSSPPPSAVEMMDSAHQRKLNRPFKRQPVIKQNSFGEENGGGSANFDIEDDLNDDAFEEECKESSSASRKCKDDSPRRPSSPIPDERHGGPIMDEEEERQIKLRQQLLINSKSLPWLPKIRQREIDAFMSQVRRKFIGYALPNEDRTTTAGLPNPILESINVLKRHLHEPLGDAQMQRENEMLLYPLTTDELVPEAVESFTETLYMAILHNLSQYLISLLKLLLASISFRKSEGMQSSAAMNVISDIGFVSTTAADTSAEQVNSVLQAVKQKIELTRHQEIIVKAISGILILLLKHYKINHIYQFEYISQQMMFANCIPLINKFIQLDMWEFILSKNSIPVLDFPACVIGEQPELTAETIETLAERQNFSWRNMFTSINFLRILNKLTKWKNCRIIMLVILKTAPHLKRALKIRNSLFQVYILKLLKMQAKFLGRQWRKNNMKTMSAIYQKVRHRLNDDWAFAHDVDSKPMYYQTEEFLLQREINRFHHRRYNKPLNNSNINSVTAQALSQANNNNNNGNVKINDYNFPSAGGPGEKANSAGMICSGFFDANTEPTAVNPCLLGTVETDLFTPVDNNLQSCLNKKVHINREFRRNYEQWLELEVFQNRINWAELLEKPTNAQLSELQRFDLASAEQRSDSRFSNSSTGTVLRRGSKPTIEPMNSSIII